MRRNLSCPLAEASEFQGAFLEARIVADVPQGGDAGGLAVAEAHAEQGFMEAVSLRIVFHRSFLCCEGGNGGLKSPPPMGRVPDARPRRTGACPGRSGLPRRPRSPCRATMPCRCVTARGRRPWPAPGSVEGLRHPCLDGLAVGRVHPTGAPPPILRQPVVFLGEVGGALGVVGEGAHVRSKWNSPSSRSKNSRGVSPIFLGGREEGGVHEGYAKRLRSRATAPFSSGSHSTGSRCFSGRGMSSGRFWAETTTQPAPGKPARLRTVRRCSFCPAEGGATRSFLASAL